MRRSQKESRCWSMTRPNTKSLCDVFDSLAFLGLAYFQCRANVCLPLYCMVFSVLTKASSLCSSIPICSVKIWDHSTRRFTLSCGPKMIRASRLSVGLARQGVKLELFLIFLRCLVAILDQCFACADPLLGTANRRFFLGFWRANVWALLQWILCWHVSKVQGICELLAGRYLDSADVGGRITTAAGSTDKIVPWSGQLVEASLWIARDLTNFSNCSCTFRNVPSAFFFQRLWPWTTKTGCLVRTWCCFPRNISFQLDNGEQMWAASVGCNRWH